MKKRPKHVEKLLDEPSQNGYNQRVAIKLPVDKEVPMFTLALLASFVTIAMIFSAPLSEKFRDLDYGRIHNFISTKDMIQKNHDRAIQVMKAVAAYSTRRDLPAIIMPTMGRTLRGLPAVQPADPDQGVFVDAGVRCHQSITYTPHI